jgi:hypothetical protein
MNGKQEKRMKRRKEDENGQEDEKIESQGRR